MAKKGVAAMLVLTFLIVVLMTAPPYARGAANTHSVLSGPSAAFSHAAAAHTSAAPTPMTGYPRSVLVETFTAEWCIYCEMESQALYQIQHSYNTTVLAVGELHICYSSSNCGDNYISRDGTGNTRAGFYGVTAFPTVFFDGAHSQIGAANTLAQMESIYTGLLFNASAVPGNVSIAQTATVTATTVNSQASITSAITGTYHVITYLVEFIGKNDSTAHDLGYVVRESLADKTVSLTAGTTTEFPGSAPLLTTWNTQHLSVITMVQENATKIVENTNMAPVSTLSTALSSNLTAITTGTDATVTVQVTNTSTLAAVGGASITLTSNNGGTLTPSSGVTASDGTFTSTFAAPSVTAPETIGISAQVSAPGYTAGVAHITLTVNPLVLSSAATGLTVTPSVQQVALNWTTPATGASGVTYYIYRATTQAGVYTAIGISPTTSFVDPGLLAGQDYWYKVAARTVAGFSANTTPTPATSVLASSQGLPPYVGWWISIDSVNFTSSTNASLPLFLPHGFFGYEFGPDSYAFLAPQPSGTLAVAGSPLTLSAAFLPRYAALQGTVTPSTATVTIGGSAVAVVGGSFTQVLAAGTYSLVVSAPGYQSNTTSIILTPGNTSTTSVALSPVAGSTGTTSSSDALASEGEISLAIAIAVAAIVGGLVMMSRRGKGGTSARSSNGGSRSSPPLPPQSP